MEHVILHSDMNSFYASQRQIQNNKSTVVPVESFKIVERRIAMIHLNGFLMSKDNQIARIENNEITPLLPDLLPIYLQRNGDLIEWLEDRAIDRHRTNSRLLKRLLRLTAAEDSEVAMRVNGSTITDTYWICRDDENLSYEDVRFHQNYFDNLALLGDPDSFNQLNRKEIINSRSPELTNIGSFEKCWRLENNQWWLYKQGNDQERFSEYFIYQLGKLLGFKMAQCELWDRGVKSLDFTNGATVNYEPAKSLVGDDVDYEFNYERIESIDPQMAKEYLDILFLDTICFNMDRHTENYGFLRDPETGQYIGMAPNFDNNIALISKGYPSNTERKNDLFIQDFLSLMDSIDIEYRIPELTEQIIKEALSLVPIEVDQQFIIGFILNGYCQIKEQVIEKEKYLDEWDLEL